jgi:PAS domain S-box-containing protein
MSTWTVSNFVGSMRGPVRVGAGNCSEMDQFGRFGVNQDVGDSQRPDVGSPDASPPWLDSLFELSPDLMCLASLDGYFRLVNPAFERTLGYTVEEFMSRPMFDFVHPEDVDRTRAALTVLAGGDELRQFENRCICRDGSVRWLQWNCRPEPNRNGLLAAAARDITDSVRRVEQAALRKVATLVAQGAAPGDVFITVAAEIARLLGADLTLIGRYERDGSFSYLAAGGSVRAPSLLEDRLMLGGENLASKIRDSGRPEWMSYVDASGPIAVFARRLGLRSAVGTPILVDGEIWGAMFACWTRHREISLGTMERLSQITELVAAAIVNAQTRSALIESRARVVAAGDETKRRIGRDLHDGAQQRLVTLALKMRSHATRIPPELTELFSEVTSGLEDILNDIRELSRGIHPAALSRAGLASALKTLGERAPLPVDVTVRISERPAERIEIAVYYVVAEALTNVAKHAQASRAVVEVVEAVGLIRVAVSDDGIGGADLSRGSGLLGLQDRVEALNGTMTVNSSASGTALVVELPTAR